MNAEDAMNGLYRRLIEGWNAGDAGAMAGALASDGLVIGFDGSQMFGSGEVETELGRIFADHQTATYVTKVRSVTPLGSDAALLHAVAGMVSPEDSQIMPTATPSRPWWAAAVTMGGTSISSRRRPRCSTGAPSSARSSPGAGRAPPGSRMGLRGHAERSTVGLVARLRGRQLACARAFMDELTAEGFIVLGGPWGGRQVLLIIEGADETSIEKRLAADPWIGTSCASSESNRGRSAACGGGYRSQPK